MTTNEQAGGESRDLDLSQFEGMTLPKAAEEAAWTTRDMFDSPQEVIIDSVAKSLWPFFEPLIAEVKRLREEKAGLKRNRCDNCGAATTGPCPDCGAPQCCPKCCAIDRLTTERDSLRANVERLTQELGEKTDAIQDAAKLIDRFRDQARRENESALRWEEKHNGLRAQIAELERDRERLQKHLKRATDIAQRFSEELSTYEWNDILEAYSSLGTSDKPGGIDAAMQTNPAP